METKGGVPADSDDSPIAQNGVKPGIKRKAVADQRAFRAYELRLQGLTWQQIGDDMGVGGPAAMAAYNRGRMMLIPKEDIESAKEIALEKINHWEQMARDIYEQDHVMVNFGRVVEGIIDYGPKIQVIDRLIKLERLRMEIIGYKAPTKRVLEVVTEDVFDKAIAELNEQAARLERDAAAQAADEANQLVQSDSGPGDVPELPL